jgi:hypothetical protein
MWKQVSKFSSSKFSASEKCQKWNLINQMLSNPKTSFNKFEVEEKELEETITIVY